MLFICSARLHIGLTANISTATDQVRLGMVSEGAHNAVYAAYSSSDPVLRVILRLDEVGETRIRCIRFLLPIHAQSSHVHPRNIVVGYLGFVHQAQLRVRQHIACYISSIRFDLCLINLGLKPFYGRYLKDHRFVDAQIRFFSPLTGSI